MALAGRVSSMSDAGGPGEETESDGDGAGGRPCPLCGEPMYSRHCKYVCPNHGVVYDCGDTFY